MIDRTKLNEQENKELEELYRSLRFLLALEEAGVDNWPGYRYAKKIFKQGEAV